MLVKGEVLIGSNCDRSPWVIDDIDDVIRRVGSDYVAVCKSMMGIVTCYSEYMVMNTSCKM